MAWSVKSMWNFKRLFNVCTDHLSRDRLEDFLQAAASRGYPRPVELQVDESLRAFGWSLAEMVRDHQSTSEDFVSRDSESSLNNLPTDVSGDGPPGPRYGDVAKRGAAARAQPSSGEQGLHFSKVWRDEVAGANFIQGMAVRLRVQTSPTGLLRG